MVVDEHTKDVCRVVEEHDLSEWRQGKLPVPSKLVPVNRGSEADMILDEHKILRDAPNLVCGNPPVSGAHKLGPCLEVRPSIERV